MSEFTSESSGVSRRGQSRGSYGMTEFSGDMTVPDGKTTYGDGMGGVLKEGSDGESPAPGEFDLVEEDSPYPEVRASVSNIDDPEMPGKLRGGGYANASLDNTSVVSGHVLVRDRYRRQHLLPLPNPGSVYLAIHRTNLGLPNRILLRVGNANLVVHDAPMAWRKGSSPEPRSF